MARYPAAASLRTMPRPSPRLPPVTRTLRIPAHDLTCRGNGQGRNKVDRRRHLVPGKRRATVLEDRVLESLAAPARGAGFSVQYHVSDDERPHDGVLLGPHLRNAHLRVGIEHRFDLLRVHLLAADVDDAVPSADEVIAFTAELHDVGPWIESPQMIEDCLVGDFS